MSKHNRMHHTNNVNVEEHNEALIYQTYPCAYYVQSPSTLSHANSANIHINLQNDAESAFHSPTRSETHPIIRPTREEDVETQLDLYGYSSSRGSSHSFLHHKKVSYDDSQDTAVTNDENHLINDDRDEDEEEEEEKEEELMFYYEYYHGKGKGGWKKYLSYKNSDSCAWIWLQMSWRVFVSLGVALLVFYIATKPPTPNVSIEIAKIPEFKLGEGVDRTGVTTKILTCNCSMNLIVENKSRFFGLHIRPPLMDMKFSILSFAFSHGPELYAESGLTIFKLELGTKEKPMYGAGRSMQDMLDSGRGLPILIRVSMNSVFHMVPNLIEPKFHHHVECVLVLMKAYDKKHRSQVFNSTCKVTS